MSLDEFASGSRGLGVYKPSEPVEELAARLNIPIDRIIKINANENLFLPKPTLQRVLAEAAAETDPRLYPGGEEAVLAGKLARLHGASPDQIVLAAGGDQIIDLAMSSLVKQGDTVLVVTPTFSMYPRTAKIKGLNYRTVSLDGRFALDGERVLAASEGASLIVLCNPNNPTSNQFPRAEVIKVVDGFQGFVLIDEAYAEYGGYSLIREALERENLLILRTFSKAYGLAGLRLGYGVTNAVLARILAERYMMPFSVPNFVLRVGARLLDERKMVLNAIEEAKREREYMVDSLNKIEGVEAFPSDTNFVLFATDKPYEEVYDGLLEKGVIIRKIGAVPGYPDCLRATVAPNEITQRFLEALGEVMA
jgi:histidinol-phosphate aminotransferase